MPNLQIVITRDGQKVSRVFTIDASSSFFIKLGSDVIGSHLKFFGRTIDGLRILGEYTGKRRESDKNFAKCIIRIKYPDESTFHYEGIERVLKIDRV